MASHCIPVVICFRFVAALAFIVTGVVCSTSQCLIDSNTSAGFIGVAIGILFNGLLFELLKRCCSDFVSEYEIRFLLGCGVVICIIFSTFGVLLYTSSSQFQGSILIGIGLSAFVDSVISSFLYIFDRKFTSTSSGYDYQDL